MNALDGKRRMKTIKGKVGGRSKAKQLAISLILCLAAVGLFVFLAWRKMEVDAFRREMEKGTDLHKQQLDRIGR